VTAGEISLIVGGPVKHGEESFWANGAVCTFVPTTVFTLPGDVGRYGAVPVSNAVVSFVNDQVFDNRIQDLTGVFGLTVLPGIGDRAYQFNGPHFSEMLVAKGSYRVLFDIYLGFTEARVQEVQLAQLVAPRIGGRPGNWPD